jgi:hypothetical protein
MKSTILEREDREMGRTERELNFKKRSEIEKGGGC